MDGTAKFVNQIVLVGASNLTRALATAVEAPEHICGRPNRLLIAAGHGRSYGLYSRVLFRSLPGITQCGLWDKLRTGPTLPTFALLTDLGNDIAYGVSTGELIGWVRWCVERFTEHGPGSSSPLYRCIASNVYRQEDTGSCERCCSQDSASACQKRLSGRER